MSAVQHRYDFVYLFDVENGNPNGDPDAGNMPRTDPETNFGLVTDVCLKRKIRNFVEISKNGAERYHIYIREKAVLTLEQKKAYTALEGQGESPSVTEARKWMCQNFFDVRVFGAVMALKEFNCGQVRGPVQFSFARSVDPIVPLEISITRMAVATEREAESQGGDNRTMGRKHIVPYGLYRTHGFISAPLAEQTGFSPEDLELLWQALMNMFDHDRSAARGEMTARKLVIFEHESKLGSYPAHKLFERVKVSRANDPAKPARSFEDYAVSIDKSPINGIRVDEKL